MSAAIQLAHGGGGALMRELIDAEIRARFADDALAPLPDAAILPSPGSRLAFTTDAFVVSPFEFPGGDIGRLAVCGTANDLSVAGAIPRYLSVALILEEGLSFAALRRVLDSIQATAAEIGMRVVTGDTKVVPRGQADGLYITTTGIGELIDGLRLGPEHVRTGDRVIVSGNLGDHGMAVMCARESLPVHPAPKSDVAPVHPLVEAVASFGDAVRFMRDPTRGGLASVAHEIVEGRPLAIELDESALPVAPTTQSVAEILGMELMHVACEGRVVAVVDNTVADEVIATWRNMPQGRGARVIGDVVDGKSGRVVLRTRIGGQRFVDRPSGELLPRIC
ncbi:MAG: hydrogenase expression/formation protein HypE [Deltaproteobacteria bacterium]|nr:hydrogenase expression/formation protein HypE [Deltaproteobacteria bacterium]